MTLAPMGGRVDGPAFSKVRHPVFEGHLNKLKDYRVDPRRTSVPENELLADPAARQMATVMKA